MAQIKKSSLVNKVEKYGKTKDSIGAERPSWDDYWVHLLRIEYRPVFRAE